MQKYTVRLIVGNEYQVEVLAKSIDEARDFALGLDDEALIDLDDCARCVSEIDLVTDESPALIAKEY